MVELENNIENHLAEVRLLLLDCDGVLTTGGVTWANNTVEMKTFHIRDGLGIKLWASAGYQTGIVTGRSSHIVEVRAQEMSVSIVRQGVHNKKKAVEEILADQGLTWKQTAFIGDDLPDLACIRHSGVGVAVADACQEVREAAMMITSVDGGRGAVREVVEQLLKAQGHWNAIVSRYLV
ncbi:MAG: HAD hydrolase family protein [Pirellulales bacterium]